MQSVEVIPIYVLLFLLLFISVYFELAFPKKALNVCFYALSPHFASTHEQNNSWGKS